MKESMLGLLVLALTTYFAAQFPARVFAGPAEDVKAALQLLESKAAALGAPRVKGEEAVAGKTVPALYFGDTKMNNNFVLVDEVQRRRAGRPRSSLRAATSSSAWQRTLKRTMDRERSAPF